MGTPNYAQIILERVIDADDIEVSLVITQPDRPVGRKKILTAPPVKILAETNGIEVLQPEKLKDNSTIEKIESLKPDFIIVAAFGQLLPKEILDIAPCINLHASLLPQYRGASPVQQSLLNGDRYSGVTAMLMEEGLDSGDILGYRYFRIPDDMGLKSLMSQLSQDACRLTLDTIREFDQIEPIGQIGANASYCKKIRKSDGEVELIDSKIIYNKYRAFEGWPGIYLKSGLKIIEMSIDSLSGSHIEAEILDIKNSTIVVGCRIGSIEISTLQPPSKRAMDAKSYLLGRGLKVGDILI
jgi:methionyl-tRNA formyltransferase